MPLLNELAPPVELPDQKGEKHTLQQYRGSWVLIYFYPKDDTPGCTTEACQIRDTFADFKKAGVVVLGVSKDSSKSHEKFVNKFALPFTLLADEKTEVAQAYGVWGEKRMLGHTYMGMKRTSFLINPEGRIAKIYENVKPNGHAAQILADVAALKNAS